jgi:hypothetical protein
VAAGEKELHLRMLKKRVFARIKEGFPFEEQGRDPQGICRIDTPGKGNKGFGVTGR